MIYLTKEEKEYFRDEIAPMLQKDEIKEANERLIKEAKYGNGATAKRAKDVLAGLCEMGYAFYGYNEVSRDVINETGITKAIIPKSVKALYPLAFFECKELAEVRFLGKVDKIGGRCFSQTALTSIEIPEGVDILNSRTFEFCNKLQQVKLPNSLTGIANGVFMGCESLTQITIPDNVQELGSRIFYDCKNLKTIEMPASLKEVWPATFKGCAEDVVLIIPTEDYWEHVEFATTNKQQLEAEVQWVKAHSKVG